MSPTSYLELNLRVVLSVATLVMRIFTLCKVINIAYLNISDR